MRPLPGSFPTPRVGAHTPHKRGQPRTPPEGREPPAPWTPCGTRKRSSTPGVGAQKFNRLRRDQMSSKDLGARPQTPAGGFTPRPPDRRRRRSQKRKRSGDQKEGATKSPGGAKIDRRLMRRDLETFYRSVQKKAHTLRDFAPHPRRGRPRAPFTRREISQAVRIPNAPPNPPKGGA